MNIELHIVMCARSRPRHVAGVPVVYVSKHAVGRLFERGFDISDNRDATSAFAFAAVLGYLTHRSPKHINGGMSLAFSDTLMVGAVDGFKKTWPHGKTLDEAVFDIRSVLEIDRLGDGKYALLEQGRTAAETVITSFKDEDEVGEAQLGDLIPALPRREDSYPARLTAGDTTPQRNQMENCK